MRRCIGVFTTELQARSERANDVRGLFMEKRRQATQLLPYYFSDTNIDAIATVWSKP